MFDGFGRRTQYVATLASRTKQGHAGECLETLLELYLFSLGQERPHHVSNLLAKPPLQAALQV